MNDIENSPIWLVVLGIVLVILAFWLRRKYNETDDLGYGLAAQFTICMTVLPFALAIISYFPNR